MLLFETTGLNFTKNPQTEPIYTYYSAYDKALKSVEGKHSTRGRHEDMRFGFFSTRRSSSRKYASPAAASLPGSDDVDSYKATATLNKPSSAAPGKSSTGTSCSLLKKKKQ
jgi:hypothetical protein